MLIIPVIDLKGGKVVHAQGGCRDRYPPLSSQLTSSIYPAPVIRQLINWFPFPIIYIADLDAIENQEKNKAFYSQLSSIFPKLTIWLDAGIRNRKDWLFWHAFSNIKPVLGSETLQDIHLLTELEQSDFILSLDFRAGKFLGRDDLLEQSHLWPKQTIVMSLDSVGAGSGPDEKLLKEIQLGKPEAELIAAGGVRGEADLVALAAANIQGVLLASALHKGNISVAKVHYLMNEKCRS